MREEDARGALLECCGSLAWAEALVRRRPFREEQDLLKASEEVWWQLGERDWREAFARHPQIGAQGSIQRWSREEQAGMQAASVATRNAIEELNRAYLEKFGYIYIVCATGKSSEEMLGILKGRLRNDAATELRAAAEEQSMITRLRLHGLISSK